MSSTLIDRPVPATARFEQLGEEHCYDLTRAEADVSLIELLEEVILEPAASEGAEDRLDLGVHSREEDAGGSERVPAATAGTYFQAKWSAGKHRRHSVLGALNLAPSTMAPSALHPPHPSPPTVGALYTVPAIWRDTAWSSSLVPTATQIIGTSPLISVGRAFTPGSGALSALGKGPRPPRMREAAQGYRAVDAVRSARPHLGVGSRPVKLPAATSIADLSRKLASHRTALAKAAAVNPVLEAAAEQGRIAEKLAASRRLAFASAAALSPPAKPAPTRYPRLRRAMEEGRITGANRPDPALRKVRTLESDPELAEADQISFGRGGDPPIGHLRRPGAAPE